MLVEAFLLSINMPEQTWSNFSASDIGLALIGIAGFVSVWVVLSTALGRTVKRELRVKAQKEAILNATRGIGGENPDDTSV